MYEACNHTQTLSLNPISFIIQLRNEEGFLFTVQMQTRHKWYFPIRLEPKHFLLLTLHNCTKTQWEACCIHFHTTAMYIKIFLNRPDRRMYRMMRRCNLLVNYNVLLLCPQNREHYVRSSVMPMLCRRGYMSEVYTQPFKDGILP